MLKLGARELLAVLLCVLMLNPSSIVAASATTAPRQVLGSIESHGSVRVGEILMPTEGTLFSGDRVQTNNGGAVIRYRQGARIVLASESLADFAPARVQLEKGLMTFQTVSDNGVVFAISTLRLEPATAKAAANVTLKDSKASVAVTEGTLKVIDPSGVQLASLNAGEARLFEEAAAGMPSPAAAPAAPPQGSQSSSAGNHSHHQWLLALGVGVVGLSLGIAGLVRAGDASDSADSANTLVKTLQSQNAALQTQINALKAQANSLIAASGQANAIIQDIALQVSLLSQAEAQLADIQRQTQALLAQIAAQGGVATPAQLSQLQSLSAQTTSLTGTVQGITAKLNTDQQNLGKISFVFSPVT